MVILVKHDGGPPIGSNSKGAQVSKEQQETEEFWLDLFGSSHIGVRTDRHMSRGLWLISGDILLLVGVAKAIRNSSWGKKYNALISVSPPVSHDPIHPQELGQMQIMFDLLVHAATAAETAITHLKRTRPARRQNTWRLEVAKARQAIDSIAAMGRLSK